MQANRSNNSEHKSNPTGETLLLIGSALLSLGFVAYFLVSIPTARASSVGKILTPSLAAGAAARDGQLANAPEGVTEVVNKALAFKALLSTTQQATLEQAYTLTLAQRWSNLPDALCGGCRNGVLFSTLTAAQVAAALEVVKAAAGTAANEGSAEFSQILLADSYLGANGGGGTYGEGNYHMAFLNTPSTTGAWMLQFGGHHYAANIAFNQGHVVATTPHFLALEPLSFTTNGTTYTPMAQERDAMAAMLASLNATQFANAKLSQTFNDVTLSPGETNRGNGIFPTTKVGIAVNTLSDAQKQLVLAAMKPWVQDMDDTVAANLLKIYERELNDTYIAFTGNATAGDASTFLFTNSNYARIDGPSVWIEFACQGGVVFRNQIHYHTIWRDRNRDYAKDLSLTTPLDTVVAAVSSVSAATFASGELASGSIVALFGAGLATGTASATSAILPTTLGGVQVQITDSLRTTRNAPLFFVSPTQINYQIPSEAATGSAVINVLSNGSTVGAGTATIAAVAPGIFTANSTGKGVPAALVFRLKADGTQSYELPVQFDSAQNAFVPTPIDLGASTDQVFLIGYGTGLRNRSSLANVAATIGGTAAAVSYAGAQETYVGLDQFNLAIPRSTAGRGNVDVLLSVDGKVANTVTINIK